MKSLLMIFVKNPILRKVKTRLAATTGDEIALEVYLKLLDHTLRVTQKLDCDKMVFYSDFIPKTDQWKESGYMQGLQRGLNLGDRMLDAFQNAFNAGYKKVLIIGSDCFDLTQKVLEEAFSLLNKKDIVIGPAKDGGYYLLGKKECLKSLFQNKRWSTNSVFTETARDCAMAGKTFSLLPVLADVDNEKDLPQALVGGKNLSVQRV